MNDTIHIDNETLVAYIYDEVDAPDKARVERHLQHCGTCGGEYAALTGVRTVLQAWAPPHAGLGFTVVPTAGGGAIRRACCGPRSGGTPCRCGRKPPPRSWCWR